MKTRLLIIFLMFSILSVSLISFADARGFSPFHFRLADEIVYDDLYFYVDGSKPNFRIDKGETATLPLMITSKHSAGTVVDFHATIGNDQMGEIRFPLGVSINLEPNQMTLNGQNQTLNVTVHVSEKAPSSKYNVQLVGVWKEEGKIPGFLGSSFSLHVGRDFGGDAISVNFFEPPLKFAREGVEPKDIPCRNALVLILRHDGAPSCVHEDTKPRLIERGWMKTQINVHNDEAFIQATKKMDFVQYFLSLYPDAEISIDRELYTVRYAESGFIEESSSRYEPIRTKSLILSLDYDGKLMPFVIECGGPVSLAVHQLEAILEHLHDPDWCFPFDQFQFDSKITYLEFSDGVVEIINPEHSPLKYKTTIPVIDDTYLSKRVEQWNDAWRSEMEFQHGIHGDEFYTELGRLLIKNEMQYQMNALGIVNANDDFEVYNGMSMESLPPHIGYSAVVHATDGNYYRLQGGTHANQVSYYKTSQLQFPDPDEEIPGESLFGKPQSITIIPEDGHKARQEPSTLVIHMDNNKVEFFNNTPETIRIQDNGSGMIGEENTLDWMGPIILPYQNATMTFDKPGLYEWDGRNAPNLDRPLWWESHANGHIVVLSDEINDFSRGDKAKIAQKMLHNTDLPLVSSGAGNAKQVLMIGIDRAVINTVPDAEEYYLKRANQLIPFDVEIVMYE